MNNDQWGAGAGGVLVDGEHTHRTWGITHGHRHQHRRAEWIAAGHSCKAMSRHVHHANAFDAVNGIASSHTVTRVRKPKPAPPMHRVVVGTVVIHEDAAGLVITFTPDPAPPVASQEATDATPGA